MLTKIQTHIFVRFHNKLGMLIYQYLINLYSKFLFIFCLLCHLKLGILYLLLLILTCFQIFGLSRFIFIKSHFRFDDIISFSIQRLHISLILRHRHTSSYKTVFFFVCFYMILPKIILHGRGFIKNL